MWSKILRPDSRSRTFTRTEPSRINTTIYLCYSAGIRPNRVHQPSSQVCTDCCIVMHERFNCSTPEIILCTSTVQVINISPMFTMNTTLYFAQCGRDQKFQSSQVSRMDDSGV